MKIGWCADLREADLLHRLGFDFIEVPLAAFGLDSRASIDTAKAAVAAAPLPTTAFNNFFPRDLRVVGHEIDADRVRTCLAGAAEPGLTSEDHAISEVANPARLGSAQRLARTGLSSM